jgi:hypothetical protein
MSYGALQEAEPQSKIKRSQKIIFKPLNLQGIAGVCPTISHIQSNLNFVLEIQSQWILFLFLV